MMLPGSSPFSGHQRNRDMIIKGDSRFRCHAVCLVGGLVRIVGLKAGCQGHLY